MEGKDIFIIKDIRTKDIVDTLTFDNNLDSSKESAELLNRRWREIRNQYPLPEYEIIVGGADSIQDFFEGFPEHLPGYQDYCWN